MSSVVDWSEINSELIDLIMKRLDLTEFIRAGAVCQSWYSTTNTSSYNSSQKPQSPWLILSSPHQPEFRYASNPADPKSLYKFNLPNMKHDYIVGSSHGFIISIDEIAQLHATNPITGSHRLLPAITTLPCCEGPVRDPITNQISSYLIRLFSTPPSRPEEFDIDQVQDSFYHKVAFFPTSSSAGLISVLVHTCFQELAFARQSDESWSYIQSPTRNFEDVLFYNGLLYAVNWKGDLVAFDILNFSASSPVPPVIYSEGWPEGSDSCDARKYLVQSPCGSNLFLIVRFSEEFITHLQEDDDDDIAVPEKTVRFKVYKLNENDGCQWSEVGSFGTDPVVVFLGFNPSVMLLAKDIPHLAADKGDCIYFTDDDFFSVARRRKKSIFDMGIFHMEDNRILPLEIANVNLQQFNYPPPFWLTPLNK